jgi:hypothetical protein
MSQAPYGVLLLVKNLELILKYQANSKKEIYSKNFILGKPL